MQQVITCNERAREVVVSQNLGGKQLGRSFHFDKVASLQSCSTLLHALTVRIML